MLPDGPEMLVALVGVAAFATAAPLNPNYLVEEFTRYLRQLEVSALIVGEDENPQAIAAARAIDIPVLRLRVDGPQAGLTSLDGTNLKTETITEYDPALLDDVALLTHTSGTTDRPKIVPLTHRNIQYSNIVSARFINLVPKCVR